jgi:hypothetical protein
MPAENTIPMHKQPTMASNNLDGLTITDTAMDIFGKKRFAR